MWGLCYLARVILDVNAYVQKAEIHDAGENVVHLFVSWKIEMRKRGELEYGRGLFVSGERDLAWDWWREVFQRRKNLCLVENDPKGWVTRCATVGQEWRSQTSSRKYLFSRWGLCE